MYSVIHQFTPTTHVFISPHRATLSATKVGGCCERPELVEPALKPGKRRVFAHAPVNELLTGLTPRLNDASSLWSRTSYFPTSCKAPQPPLPWNIGLSILGRPHLPPFSYVLCPPKNQLPSTYHPVNVGSGMPIKGLAVVDSCPVAGGTSSDLHLEFAVAARQFRCALPLDLQVKVALAGSRRCCVRRCGLRLGVGDLLLQRLDGCLHLSIGRLHFLDLRLDLLQILCLLCLRLWSGCGQKADNARAR